jgi:predicted  nucleic acid-binding Zn-ribbon protein
MESTPRPDSRPSAEDKAPELNAVRQRIHDIKREVRELETEREEKLDEQWTLFLETAALQEKKLRLREAAAATYHQLEVSIFELKKEYTTLMTAERALNEQVLEHE